MNCNLGPRIMYGAGYNWEAVASRYYLPESNFEEQFKKI